MKFHFLFLLVDVSYSFSQISRPLTQASDAVLNDLKVSETLETNEKSLWLKSTLKLIHSQTDLSFKKSKTKF
jgi:hypothetical protein